MNLRGAEEEKYVLIDITEFERGGTAKLVEEIEISRALFEVYEGGVVRTMWFWRSNKTHCFHQFMHQGLTFVVNSISHDNRVAHLRRADVNWITGLCLRSFNGLADADIDAISRRTEVRVLWTVESPN